MPGLNDIFNAMTGRGVNKKDDNGETRLFKAVRSGSLHEVKKLLRSGADPDISDPSGLSPLHIAAYWGDADIVDALLKSGANAKVDNGQGWTPLHSASISGGHKTRERIIQALRGKGADDSVKDKHGWTPADYMQIWEDNAAAVEKLRAFLLLDNAHAPENSRKTQRNKTTKPRDPAAGH